MRQQFLGAGLGCRQAQLRHHQRLDRFGLVLEDRAVEGQRSLPVHEPVGELVHEHAQLLVRGQPAAQHNLITSLAAVQAVRKRHAAQAQASSTRKRLQGVNVLRGSLSCLRDHRPLRKRRPTPLALPLASH